MPNERSDYEISILVPQAPAGAAPPTPAGTGAPDAIENHALWPWGRRVETVDLSNVEAQWSRTIGALMRLASSAGDHARGWGVEEISVALTLSASGELLFIAEAGVSGTVTVTLKRREPAAGDGEATARD